MIKIKNLQDEKVTVTIFNHATPKESHRLAATEFISLQKGEHIWATDHQAKYFMSDKKDDKGVVIGKEFNPKAFETTIHDGNQNNVKSFRIDIEDQSASGKNHVLTHNLPNAVIKFPNDEIEAKFTVNTSIEGKTILTLKAEETEGFSFVLDVLYHSL